MKILFILLTVLLLCISAQSAQAQIVMPTLTEEVTDSLGNQLTLYNWTRFDARSPFHHPNGYDYPQKGQGLMWVYAEPKRYTNYQGILTLAGLLGGTIYVWQQSNSLVWDDWDDVGVFFGTLATSTIIGWILDDLARPKTRQHPAYRYICRGRR
ncbi:hypothetical protein KKF32_01540 [Patescibacteria group bacterium]|nr:hypothetical protein [Patescibacteria group bacterium]